MTYRSHIPSIILDTEIPGADGLTFRQLISSWAMEYAGNPNAAIAGITKFVEEELSEALGKEFAAMWL
jgi:hypothetical protein